MPQRSVDWAWTQGENFDCIVGNWFEEGFAGRSIALTVAGAVGAVGAAGTLAELGFAGR